MQLRPTNAKIQRLMEIVAMPAKVMSREPSKCAAAAPHAHNGRPCCSSMPISAENVENVVSPPQKPVMISKRHSGASVE